MTSYQHASGLADVSPQRHGAHTRWSKALCLGVLAGSLLIAGFGLSVPSALAASTSMVDLGQASTYAALSGASVGNTVSAPGAPYTTLRGDLGVDASAQPTGFPPGVVTGTVNIGNAAATQAHGDLVTAYNEALRSSRRPIATSHGPDPSRVQAARTRSARGSAQSVQVRET